ncbi:unnamed protein product [Protopolystoma xenopodis]|uniref:Fibronectin type-III domain-containing protein n=1 Tax=Protopolystoma xenopodis TaxID=117903 RepID=A0A3S5CCE9_9PLAT|nr:unnamed protein product [Protopolystoma xenopodis]
MPSFNLVFTFGLCIPDLEEADDMELLKRNESSITLAWEPSSSGTAYQLTVTSPYGGRYSVRIPDIKTRNYTVNFLEPCVTYEFHLQTWHNEKISYGAKQKHLTLPPRVAHVEVKRPVVGKMVPVKWTAAYPQPSGECEWNYLVQFSERNGENPGIITRVDAEKWCM